MFDGSGELLLILVVALIVVGPARLPELIRAFGKGLAEFRRMTSDVKATLEREIERADELKRIGEIKKELFDEADKAKQVLTGMAQDVGGHLNEVGGQLGEVAREAGVTRPESLERPESLDAAAQASAGEQAEELDSPAVDQTGEPLAAETRPAQTQGQVPPETASREAVSLDVQDAPGAREEGAAARTSAPASPVVSSESGENPCPSPAPSPQSSPEPGATPNASPASREEKSHA